MVDIARFDMVAQMTLTKGRLDLVIVAHQVHRGWCEQEQLPKAAQVAPSVST